jgi:hypothetical protein
VKYERNIGVMLVLLASLAYGGAALGGELRKTSESKNHWRGEYKNISYDSKCSNQKCELELKIGAKTVRATRLLYGDDDTTLRFHGLKMTEAYRDALVELEQLTNTDGYMGPAEMLLHSLVTMLQEAPLGWTMEDMDLKRPPGTPIQREVFPGQVMPGSDEEKDPYVDPPGKRKGHLKMEVKTKDEIRGAFDDDVPRPRRSSNSSRDLPIPGSPVTKTIWPRLPLAFSKHCRNVSSS